jgi:hypothetical protein
MKPIKFVLEDEYSLIVVKARIDNEKLSLAIDTGASHSVIDLSMMIITGYEIQDALQIVELETAKGIVEAYIFKVNEISALGQTIKDIEVCSYDFFDHNIFTTIHGVIGLDFFNGKDLLISFKRFEIEVY